MGPIEFWFDFSSAYAYFAAQEIEALAARQQRTLLWRPYMLGTAFKATGAQGLSRTPLKGDYARRDWARLSRLLDVPFYLPPGHPITALPATRAYYWIEERTPEAAAAFAREIFRAYYVEGRDLTTAEGVAAVAAPLGLDPESLVAGIAQPELKARVKRQSEQAIERGIFGSPFFVVDDEPFWGWDRMPMLEKWLAEGGW